MLITLNEPAGLRERIWWGAASNPTAVWTAENGMNLQSSTLKFDESGKPFHIQQAEQIRVYKEAWKKAEVSSAIDYRLPLVDKRIINAILD